MSINNLNTYLNVRDAHLRVVSGNVYAEAMNIGGINVETAHGLQSVSNTGNATSLTLEFANVTTGFVTTANAQIGRDLVVTGNATVSTDLTVSANATVTDTLTVSEHLLASKEATVTGNLHVTTIMSDSNVVAEYTGPHDRPLRKYPEVALTSASQGGYVVTPSTQNGVNVPAYNMFDGDRSTRWRPNATNQTYDTSSPFLYNGNKTSRITDTSGTPHDGVFLKLELPKAIKLDHTIIRENSDPASGTPGKITFLGSTNGTDWTFLKEFSGMSSTALDETYTINDTNYYNHFAFVVKNLSDTSGELTLGEWELYGYEEGSGSLDTTLKSVYNVPATTGTQLEVYYDAKDLTTMPSTVTDLAGGDQNGTVTGHSPTLDTNGISSFVFDGVDDYIESTLTNDSGAWIFSKSLWFKQTTGVTGANYSCISSIGDYSVSDATFFYLNDTHILVSIYSSGVYFPAEWIVNEWTHAVVVMKGTTSSINDIELYINGKKVEATSQFGTATTRTLPANAQLRVGREVGVGTSYFTGSIANFRLYSKALNAGQIQELYDYQKDYFLGSKSQVTLYKGHLGVGVTEPSGQLELAGDERIQEYPPGPLTNYETHIPGHGVFCWYTPYYYQGNFETHSGVGMYAKDEGTTGWYGPYNGNSGYTGGNVYAGTDFAATSSSGLGFNDAYGTRYYGAWTTFKLPYKINLKRLRIRQWGTTESINSRCAPEDGVILGSNDGTKWYHVHTFTGLQYGGSAGSYSFSAAGEYVTINCNTDYNQYVLITTRTLHYAFTVIIGELQWFGTPGPTTLDKGSLTLGRSLDVPRVSRYDVDTETPRPEKLVLDFDTTVNSSPTDISGKGNHGVFKGTAQYSPAEKAFSFDGNSDYIQGTLNLNGSELDGSYTLSAWVKRSSTTNTESFLFYIGTDGTGDSIGFYSDSATSYKLFHYNATTAYATSQPSILNTYRHIVATYDGTYRRIYIDGVMVDVTNTGVSAPLGIPNNPTFSLGMRYTNLSDTQEFLHGYMSNPKIYSVALEPSEVKKLYKLGRTGRSMVISDTAVGIGKVPEAQLDVRGNLKLNGLVMPHIIAGSWRMTGGNPSTTTIYLNEGNCVKAISNQNVAGQGNGVSGNRGQFTAPVTGLYNISFNFIAGTRNSSNYLGSYSASGGAILTSPMGSYREMFDMRSTDNVQESYAYTMCATMDAGDIVKFSTYSSSYVDSGALIVGSAHLIYAIPRATW